ncbi:MAG: hypothetical protein IKC59_02565 [Clostridia bacterium]|nr:hypothetical protein [Clostridia bacterium]MBR7098273.1 hypothetical protein [Clostridia bacterium]
MKRVPPRNSRADVAVGKGSGAEEAIRAQDRFWQCRKHLSCCRRNAERYPPKTDQSADFGKWEEGSAVIPSSFILHVNFIEGENKS